MLNKKSFLEKLGKGLIALLFWIAVWQIASMLLNDSLKLFLPSPFAVIQRWFEIIPDTTYLKATAFTLLRILAGFFFGGAMGIILGILGGM